MAPVRATAIEGLLASELRRWAIGNGTGLSADERLNYWRRQEISTRVTQEAKEDAIAANETLLRTAVEGGDTAEVDRLAGAIEQYRRGLEHATHQREEIRSRMADLWAEVERETKDGQVENGDV